MVAAELAGGGFVSTAGVDLADRAVARLLTYFGVRPDRGETEPPAQATEFFEPLFRLHDRVDDGQLAGRLHSIDAPWQEPVDVFLDRGGVVICQRAFGRAALGGCLGHTVVPFAPAE